MKLLADEHLHTSYGDGDGTVFEMGRAAFEKGLKVIGFSEHGYSEDQDAGEPFGIRGDELDLYINDVYTLRDMYRGQMDVLCGLEMENLMGYRFVDDFQRSQLDYIIGSTHCIEKDGIIFSVDDTEEKLVKAVEELYGGDWYGMARDYFSFESEVFKNTNCDIIGHFDLVKKFNKNGRYFDENDERYLAPAKEALENLLRHDAIFEINPGAISRGYRDDCYPSVLLLDMIRERGGRICINSDAHDPYFIGFWVDEALKLARECGFKRISVLTYGGPAEIDISSGSAVSAAGKSFTDPGKAKEAAKEGVPEDTQHRASGPEEPGLSANGR